MHLCVELGDVLGDFTVGFSLGFAGEGLALIPMFVEVPYDALPAAVGAPENIAVGG
jgi:hypothetical protein